MATDPPKATLVTYANDFEVGFNACEVLIRCGQTYPELPVDYWHTQIATTPHCAKLLMQLLQKSIGEYEREFGAIQARKDPPDGAE